MVAVSSSRNDGRGRREPSGTVEPGPMDVLQRIPLREAMEKYSTGPQRMINGLFVIEMKSALIVVSGRSIS